MTASPEAVRRVTEARQKLNRARLARSRQIIRAWRWCGDPGCEGKPHDGRGKHARYGQRSPAPETRITYMRGGRGSGKTFAAVHAFAERFAESGEGEWGLVSPTFADARSMAVESPESGLLVALGTSRAEVEAGRSRLVEGWNRSLGELTLRSGARLYATGAENGAVRIQGKNLRGVLCVAAGEPVLTSLGPVSVEAVRPGMLAWTRDGWRRVLAQRRTGASVPVLRVSAASGASVRVTPDHRVWVERKGWVEARSLRYGDILSVWSSPPGRLPGSNGKTSAGTAAARAVTTQTASASCFTSPFGSGKTGRPSPPATSSTTVTMTRPTTTPPTLNWSPGLITSGITTSMNRAASPFSAHPSASASPSSPGSSESPESTRASYAERASRQSASEPCTALPAARKPRSTRGSNAAKGPAPRFQNGTANGAAARSHLLTGASSTALAHAKSRPTVPPKSPATGSALGSATARTAEPPSSPGTGSRSTAPSPARSSTAVTAIEPDGLADVYDLTVEDAHEFVAGGILVHNCDEIGLWDRWETAWDESIRMATRLEGAFIIATGTPKSARKSKKLVRRLVDDPKVDNRLLRTTDNAANLSQAFLEDVTGGLTSRLSRQELEGELLDDPEGALWSWETLDASRVSEHPPLVLVVIAVDPAVTSGEDSDETGIVVAGKGTDGHGYVLADLSFRGHPAEVARRIAAAYEDHAVNFVVAEVNNGGDYVGTLIRGVQPDIGYRTVHATRGKYLRAEPIAALYEQARVHHLARFEKLEEQMTQFEPGSDEHDDRLDAMVYAITALKVEGAGMTWLDVYAPEKDEQGNRKRGEDEPPNPWADAYGGQQGA